MTECNSALIIKGEWFLCDTPTDEDGAHIGWGHSNRQAEAIWINEDEEIEQIVYTD